MMYSNPKMLLYMGYADAYAMATEFVPAGHPVIGQALSFDADEGYLPNPMFDKYERGRYTDDTEMSAANVKVILGEYPMSDLGFAWAWLHEFRRGGNRLGYSSKLRTLMQEVSDPGSLLRRLYMVDPTTGLPHNHSDKNGAAMRSVPFGAMPKLAEMLELVTLQASITHDTPAGLFSARAVALMSHYMLYEFRSFEKMGAWCVKHLLPEDREFASIFTASWHGRVEARANIPLAISTVWAVAYLLKNMESLMGMLQQTIAWGGDTDTVAAIAWGIAAGAYIHEPLPSFFENSLEHGKEETGVPYLLNLGERLMARFNLV